MKNLLNLNFSPKEAGSAARGADFLSLTVKKGDKETSASFSAELDFPLSDEIFFDYSILGLYRGLAYRTPLIYLTSDEGEVTPLIAYDDLNTDGGRYKVSAKVPKGEYTHINIDIAVDRAKVCELKIFKLYTACACEMPAALSHFERSPLSSVYPIDISNLFDARYDFDKNEIKIGGGKAFEKTSITPHGIPFSVKIEGVNAASFPAPPKENDEIIENFGVRAKRGVCRPVTRNSALSVKIDKCASEIYFILGMDGERYQRYTFATKGNILGTYGREVTKPLFVDDVEGFYVEIIYSSGKKDISFPKNITENRFSVSGDVSVYAVGTDYEEISSVVFHNKKLTTEFSLLAVSVNEAPVGYFPDLEIPKQAHYPERIASKDSYVKCEGDRLTIKNGAISLGADVSEHLALSYLESDYAKSLKCCTGSLIRLVCESGEELSFPRVTSVSLDESTAAVNLVGEGLEFTVKFDISENDRVLLSLSVKNCGSEEKRVGIIFPAIDTVEGESSDDLYYFVPKYQNINSNETIVVHEESSPSFPMQFLSVYSKSEGAGLGLLTRERETKVRIYHLEKRENKASLGVEYPAMYTKIAAGGEFFATDAVLEAADGDWHKTFDSYREWLASWYVPYKCQNKQWYRECFWLLAEITDFFETYEMVKFPIWHELGKPKFNFLNILEEQKKISGAYPDILHMWHWTVRYDENGKKRVKWGNWGGEDYDIYGGLAPFRAALDEFQEKTGVYSSMYMHPTLFASSYPHFKEYEHLKTVNEKGEYITLADSFRMCHANADWRDYALRQYPRVYSELGVPILYVDEFSLRIENRCYGENHGHEVPSNLLKTDREFISRLKDTVPEELVLYGEYAAVDVNARYIDCNITYGFLDSITEMIERSWRAEDSQSILGRVMTDAYRFAFPKIVQLVLPMALRNLSWQPHKFIFWNGEAEYDSFWDVLETDGNDFTCKAYAIKKKYADCFSSDNPEMMVETPSPAICINKFPAKERTVYTVYNRAYRTYRGAVLRIEHVDGATYYDAWQERKIEPKIEGGYAEISLELAAQSVGCICVSHPS